LFSNIFFTKSLYPLLIKIISPKQYSLHTFIPSETKTYQSTKFSQKPRAQLLVATFDLFKNCFAK